MTDSTDTIQLNLEGVDEEPVAGNQRQFVGWQAHLFFWLGVAFTTLHLLSLNVYPLETWAYRILHIAGALVLGFGLMAPFTFRETARSQLSPVARAMATVAGLAVAWPLFCVAYAWTMFYFTGQQKPPDWVFAYYGWPLALGTGLGLLGGYLFRGDNQRVSWSDWILLLSSIAVAGFIVFSLDNLALRMRAGTPFADIQNFWAALVGAVLILELTRRVAGLALVIIALVFVAYSFLGPFLPGFLTHTGYPAPRFFTYLYTDNGILGPTTAVSSTYIILFITFAAFLQASRVGEYFVSFAFAAAGRARGGPAKVAVFASGLMGMINGTSAGNVVATGSLTIPLMKKVGYRPKSAAAIEAAASTGGQIMPPIMGAGAFIMAEITGIPYTELVISALIPAILYFASIYFMVDLEATKMGMRGMRPDELPVFAELIKRVYLFLPIVILIGALFMGYSVIRAGTLATVAAVVVSWLSPHKMGPKSIITALELAARMSIQIVAVCACAGIIVGVISLTGVGARFSALLLGVAGSSLVPPDLGMLLAMFFAMCIAIILGMGMPTTAAYAVAAAVVAPGLVQLGIQPLVAHFFVFYFAVVSAITPPVALAAYAGAAIAGSNPMATSAESFKIGLAAFIVPFIFFYSPAMLMEGSWLRIIHVFITASVGIYLLAAAVQGWFFGRMNGFFRIILLVGALMMIKGGWMTDVLGIGIGVMLFLLQRSLASRAPLTSSS